jgi:hypothetical protein
MSAKFTEGTQVKEEAALTTIDARALNTEGQKIKLVVAGNARKIFCSFRGGAGFAGCLGAECEAWRQWDDERGYCEKHLEESGACQIYQQIEVA